MTCKGCNKVKSVAKVRVLDPVTGLMISVVKRLIVKQRSSVTGRTSTPAQHRLDRNTG